MHFNSVIYPTSIRYLELIKICCKLINLVEIYFQKEHHAIVLKSISIYPKFCMKIWFFGLIIKKKIDPLSLF